MQELLGYNLVMLPPTFILDLQHYSHSQPSWQHISMSSLMTNFSEQPLMTILNSQETPKL
jgi:hypothetical protein